MEIKQAEAIIEVLLFAYGDLLPVATIAETIQMDIRTTKALINKMIDDFNRSDRGIMIKQVNDAFQLCTKKEYMEYVKKIFNNGPVIPLSQAAYEVLAIVAYKQPVTRSVIENIRGVNSESALSKLIERNYIKECGKLDAPGRPSLYEVTEEFLKSFGLRTIEELPDIEICENEI